MLNTKTYTRQELIELLKTDRIDSIKSKLTRRGYVYTTSGRGVAFTLTITQTPPLFRNFCVERLGFAPQTDFVRLKKVLYMFFFDEQFRNLPYGAMALYLEKQMHITYQTLSNWIGKLEENNLIWRSIAEFEYYVSTKGILPIPITAEVYSEAWKSYWGNREDGWQISRFRLEKYAGGLPYKQGIIIENAFELDTLNELKEILLQEINIDE